MARALFDCWIFSNFFRSRLLIDVVGIACRRCYGLAYQSQQQTAQHRRLGKARKIGMRLGGTADLLEPFPPRPNGMHRRTFQRLRAHAEAAVFGRRGLGCQLLLALFLC